MAELMSPEAAISYWDTRHREHGALRSGGHIGIDHAANEVFYLSRLGKLIDIIGDRTSPENPFFLLDAGCGKGYFSRALIKCGFLVDGIDTSEHAISECRRLEPRGRYEVSSLSGWHNPYLYDVVYSMDVLFHILDDLEWERSIRNLASLTRFSGKLILTDEFNNARRNLGNYIVHRAHDEYTQTLAPLGFRFDHFRPYLFRDNKIGFFVFTRTH